MRQALPRTALLLLITPLIGGCVHRVAYRYPNAAVAISPNGRFRPAIIPGSDVVLTFDYDRGLLPFPDAVAGFSFFIAIRPSLLVEGTHLTVPQSGVLAAASVLRAPAYVTAADVVGTISILGVSDAGVTVQIDLQSDQLRWSFRSTVVFVTVPPGKPLWG